VHRPGGGGSADSDVDVRLVAPALTGWVVTAAGIWWPIGRALAACCVVLVAAGALAHCVARGAGRRRLPAVGAGVVAVGVVGAGFGLAIGLRADAVGRHPITAAFGTAAPVTVTPSETALSLGSGRVMFRANLRRLRDDDVSGRVVVFARASDFGDLMVGQPVRFTARINRSPVVVLTMSAPNGTGKSVLSVSAVKAATDRIRSRSTALTLSAASAGAARIPRLKEAAPVCARKLRRFTFMRSSR
jgi:competence protein ComEC